MTRLYGEGEEIAVTFERPEAPQAFTWRGRRYVVDAIAKRWRVDTDWWTKRVWREYFKLTTKNGFLLILYHDLVADKWYVQRLYD